MAAVNNNVNQETRYVIDSKSGDWREAKTPDEKTQGVTAENRRYHDAGDSWIASRDGEVTSAERRYSDAGDTWVADKNGEVAHAYRSYNFDNDGNLVADSWGQVDADGRLAFHQTGGEEISQDGDLIVVRETPRRTEFLGAYIPDNDGIDGYDVRTLQYGKSNTYFDFITVDGNGNRLIDWDKRATKVAQRFLDLMNDTTGAVTDEMKDALAAQASYSYVEGVGVSWNDNVVNMNQSFGAIVDFYLKNGEVRMATEWAPDNRTTVEKIRDGADLFFGGKGYEPKMLRPGLSGSDETRQVFRMALKDMIDVIEKVTAKLQPPSPGQKEAASLLDRAFSGSLIDDATDQFNVNLTQFGI